MNVFDVPKTVDFTRTDHGAARQGKGKMRNVSQLANPRWAELNQWAMGGICVLTSPDNEIKGQEGILLSRRGKRSWWS